MAASTASRSIATATRAAHSPKSTHSPKPARHGPSTSKARSPPLTAAVAHSHRRDALVPRDLSPPLEQRVRRLAHQRRRLVATRLNEAVAAPQIGARRQASPRRARDETLAPIIARG
eukprot:921328-Prymnesium_polylepis.1